jgi:hypothetical protein
MFALSAPFVKKPSKTIVHVSCSAAPALLRAPDHQCVTQPAASKVAPEVATSNSTPAHVRGFAASPVST